MFEQLYTLDYSGSENRQEKSADYPQVLEAATAKQTPLSSQKADLIVIHKNINEARKFMIKDDLVSWLQSRGIDEEDVGTAANLLFSPFNKPSRLLGINSDYLLRVGLGVPLSMELSDKLKARVIKQGLHMRFTISRDKSQSGRVPLLTRRTDSGWIESNDVGGF